MFCKKGAFPVQYDAGTHACTRPVHPLTKRKEDLKGYAVFFTVSVLFSTASLEIFIVYNKMQNRTCSETFVKYDIFNIFYMFYQNM